MRSLSRTRALLQDIGALFIYLQHAPFATATHRVPGDEEVEQFPQNPKALAPL